MPIDEPTLEAMRTWKRRLDDALSVGDHTLFVTPAEYAQLRTLNDDPPPPGHGTFMVDALGPIGIPVVIDAEKATRQRQGLRVRPSSPPAAP